jgi:membrane associated rhomboid family serine protease
MVMPLSDDDSGLRITPWANYLLIAINVFVFVFLQQLGNNVRFTFAFATVPEEIVTGRDVETPDRVVEDPVTRARVRVPGLQPTPIPVYLTLITSMFMHGGIMHLAGNMLFLWIFGDNIEDAVGHLRYLVFYVTCGVIAALAHVAITVLVTGERLMPMLGASGAISGVLGAYLFLFPRRRVTVLLFRVLMDVPAYVALGIWFLFQLVSGLGILGGGSQVGGVAYAAHIGGFIAGIGLINVFPFDQWRQFGGWRAYAAE